VTYQESAAEVRETSGVTTRLVLGYVRTQGGDDAVQAVLDRAGVGHSLADLEDEANWVSYDARIRLFAAAQEVLGDPRTMYEVGGSVWEQQVSPSLILLLRALGSPAQVFRQLPRSVSKFSSTSTMRMLEVGRTNATIWYQLHDGFEHSRLDCAYAQGLFCQVPVIFGLPPAQVVHDECQSDGAPACVYHVTWSRRSRFLRRRIEDGATDELERTALRLQLEGLQSAASDLVSSDDLEQVLTRIIERASSAVVAQGYLLAVRSPSGGEPLVRARGVAPERLPGLVAALLDGADLGPSATIVDIASTRRAHGRLAALHSVGQQGMINESSLLQAYARHAAAALDMLIALEDSRRGEARAEALLGLAHRLAGNEDTQEVAQLVVAALPQILGCTAASVLLWDPVDGELRGTAAVGLEPEQRRLFLSSALRPADTPELAQMLQSHEPLVLDREAVGPVLRGLLTALGVEQSVAVPLLAGGELLGAVTASWGARRGPADLEVDLRLRLQGVGDQAATALQNAQLVGAIRYQAMHDALTGLPNRVLFADRLDQALRATGRSGAGAVGVLFCDLDRFKEVNDLLGHAAGDELLRQVAERLSTAVRDGDSVGRLSGDEFAALLPDIEDLDAATAVARRVTACFERPFRVEGRELRVTTSVGVGIHVGPDGRVDTLLRSVDAAMYQAKQRGRNQIALVDQLAPAPDTGLPSLEHELAAALEAGHLHLLFQPIVDVVLGRPVGAEALVRWEHPRLGTLSPASFLPLAEDSGLVVELDSWVVREACRALAAADAAGAQELRVAVNLSGRTLGDPAFVGRVREALQDSGLAADRLELEVVESRSLVDLPGINERLTALRRLGVRIALDDFGTGFSTLTWLHRLPADSIKVDRSFIDAVDTDPASFALVRGVLALAQEIGLEVVAEGVETEQQLRTLRAAGCRLVQGYLLGRPDRSITVAGEPVRDLSAAAL
jgi:diguanylate cyclase (GGDEF)-like protein